jgi:hypothetical protein
MGELASGERGRRMSSSLRRIGRMSVIGFTFAFGASFLLAPTSAFADTAQVFYLTTNAGYGVYSSNNPPCLTPQTPGCVPPPASVSAQFSVPALSCANSNSAASFGVLDENSDGTVNANAFVDEWCSKHKTPNYDAGIEIDGTLTSLSTTITPGALIAASASLTPSGASATLTDNSTGFTQTETGAGTAAFYGFVGSFPPGNPHVAEFGQISFTNTAVNNQNLASYQGSTGLYEDIQAKKPSIKDPQKSTQIQPGPLNSGGFSLQWVHK